MTDQEQGARQSIADADVPIVHSVDIPSIYIDGAQGFAAANGAVRVTFFQLVNHFTGEEQQTQITKVFNVQLVMQPSVLHSLAAWLTQRSRDIEETQAEATETPDGE